MFVNGVMEQNTMPIKFLKTLIAISEKGNFSEAADRVCVTPAAVSQQMKRLEEVLDVDLFVRDKRTPELTQAGKTLIPKAREIVRAYDSMLHDLKTESAMSGELTIGAVSSSLAMLLPMSIKSLLSKYPEIHIRVITAPSHDLFPLLERGAIDAAVMSQPSHLRHHFKWQMFAEEEMVVICSKELDSDDPIELLMNNPYIRMSRQALAAIVADDILHEAKLNIQDVMELDSIENVVSMVSHNLGVAIVPRPSVVDPSYQGLKMIPLKAKHSRVMGVLSKQDNAKFNMVDALLAALVETIHEGPASH